ncbi:hypothetical protein EC991_009386 [Linnemannia zychae]|nr:hypothetical protein EC991_009386 [Linnemannia zychae]
MPRRPQANNQKIAISASAVEHPLLDHSHLDQHQQLQHIEQQIQQQQERFQQQHQLQQLQQEHSQQTNDADEEDEDEEDEEDDEDDEEEEGDNHGAATASCALVSTVPKAPLRSNGVIGRNVNLTNSQRKAICQMRIDNPEMTLSSLGQWAQKEFNLFRMPAMGTLSRIVHKNDVYSNMSAMELQVQRKRTVLCPELEDALLEWIRECQEREIHIAYRMITKKGYELGAHIKSMPGRENFTLPSFSNGWVSGFTKRNGLLGANLNPAASVLPMPEDEFNPRPFSTNQQLLERVLQPRYRQRAAAHSQQNNSSTINSDTNVKIDRDNEQDHGTDVDMDSALSDMNTDLHHQVIHAVASSSSYSTTQSAVPDMPQVAAPHDTNVKKPRGRKPRGGGTATSTRRGKVAKVTEIADAAEASHMMDVEEASDELFQPLDLQQQQQHQMHPAAPGSSNLRARAGDRVSSTETPALLASPLAHPQTHPTQTLHQLQQQQQQLQTILQQPPVSLAGGSSNSDLVTVATADAVANATSASHSSPTTMEVISAIRIVIENLDATISGEAQLLKPLFNMERRLQDQIIAEGRQANMMNWK